MHDAASQTVLIATNGRDSSEMEYATKRPAPAALRTLYTGLVTESVPTLLAMNVASTHSEPMVPKTTGCIAKPIFLVCLSVLERQWYRKSHRSRRRGASWLEMGFRKGSGLSTPGSHRRLLKRAA